MSVFRYLYGRRMSAGDAVLTNARAAAASLSSKVTSASACSWVSEMYSAWWMSGQFSLADYPTSSRSRRPEPHADVPYMTCLNTKGVGKNADDALVRRCVIRLVDLSKGR